LLIAAGLLFGAALWFSWRLWSKRAIESAARVAEPSARELLARAQLERNAYAAPSFVLSLSGPGGGNFWIDSAHDPPRITEGAKDAPCTIRLAASDYVEVVRGLTTYDALLTGGKLALEAKTEVTLGGRKTPLECVHPVMLLDSLATDMHGRITTEIRAFCSDVSRSCGRDAFEKSAIGCETRLGHAFLAADKERCTHAFAGTLECDRRSPPACVDGVEHTAPACRGAFEKLEACLKPLGCMALEKPYEVMPDGSPGTCRIRCWTNATSFDVECKNASGGLSCACPPAAGAPHTFNLEYCEVLPASKASELIESACLDGNLRPLGWSKLRRR